MSRPDLETVLRDALIDAYRSGVCEGEDQPASKLQRYDPTDEGAKLAATVSEWFGAQQREALEAVWEAGVMRGISGKSFFPKDMEEDFRDLDLAFLLDAADKADRGEVVTLTGLSREAKAEVLFGASLPVIASFPTTDSRGFSWDDPAE